MEGAERTPAASEETSLAAAADPWQPDTPVDPEAPVMLTDAMCGVACQVMAEPRQA